MPYFAELGRFWGQSRKKWVKIDRYLLRMKFSPQNLVFSCISLMAIFAGDHPQRGR